MLTIYVEREIPIILKTWSGSRDNDPKTRFILKFWILGRENRLIYWTNP